MTEPESAREGLTRRAASVPSRVWLVAGVLIAFLALGLPWAHTREGAHIPGWYVAGSCVSMGDGSVECTGGFLNPGYNTPDTTSYDVSGHVTIARFFIAAAIILAFAAWRRQSRQLTLGVVVVSVLSVFFVSRSLTSGSAAILLAALCIWMMHTRQAQELRSRGVGT